MVRNNWRCVLAMKIEVSEVVIVGRFDKRVRCSSCSAIPRGVKAGTVMGTAAVMIVVALPVWAKGSLRIAVAVVVLRAPRAAHHAVAAIDAVVIIVLVFEAIFVVPQFV